MFAHVSMYPRLFVHLATVAILATVYLVAAKLGLSLAFVHASATAVWPPTGIALAAGLVLGQRAWPGVWLGAFLANITTAGSVATSIGIALGNTLEGLVGAYLTTQFANGRHAFDQPRDVLKFTLLAAVASTAISATLGVFSLCLGGFADWAAYGPIWLTWWLGDVVGALIVAPLLILWSVNPRLRWNRRQAIEALILLASLSLAGLTVFGGLLPWGRKHYPLEFICIPLLIWAAFRFTQRETATVACVLSGIAIWGTLRGFGPFFTDSPNESLLLLQVFMGLVAVMSLILAATVSERRHAEAELQRAHSESELRVQERTTSLSTVIQALHTEIAERKQVEAALRASQVRLAGILEIADEAIIAVNTSQQIQLFNQGAERIFGYTAQEVIGQPLDILLPARMLEAHRRHISSFAASTEVARKMGERRDIYGRRSDGSEFPAEASISKLDINNETVLTVFLRDISERKRTEEALKTFTAKLERSNRELQEFASVASHDLQEPLRKVQAFGDLLKEEYAAALDAEGRNYLERMQNAAGRMQTLINDLLRFARLGNETRPFKAVDLNQVGREVLADLDVRIAQTGGRVELGDLPIIEADPVQIRQLFQNVIGNALKFYRPEDPPAVKVQGQLIAANRPDLAQQGLNHACCQISIVDNGIGFDEKYLDRIFTVFQRLHGRGEYEGNGIGLAICRKIVERHGGNITATSAPGQGTTFIITLPVNQPGGRSRS